MNLAVRRRLSDLRTVLLGGQIHRQKKRQVQKNRDAVRKMSRLHGCCLKMQNPSQNTKKALQNARLVELITRFELVTSSLPRMRSTN